VAIFLILV